MVAVVTGASDGIGKQTAMQLVKKGYTVYDISHHRAVTRYSKHITADVSDKKALEKAIEQIYTKEDKVDLLVCSAGVSLASPMDMTRVKDARRVYDVNFWGSVYAAQLVLRRMKQEKAGRIIFVSSMTGVLPLPYLSFYTSSKAALINFASALSGEAKPFGVKVTAVLPGGVSTQFSDKRKKYTELENDKRAPGLKSAIQAITAIEQKGYSPRFVAAEIVRAAENPNPPPVLPVGTAMKALYAVERLLPPRLLDELVQKVFAK